MAKKFYLGYLSDEELPEDERKALNYFNNETLDNVLQQAMTQYFAIPVVQELEDFQTLENTIFLRPWLKDELIEKYREEVKTNQNLITNVYYKIPGTEEIYDYNKLINKPLPLTPGIVNSFKEYYPEEVIHELNNLDSANLITYLYESAINDSLKSEIELILITARRKIYELRNKYPDEPSEVKQGTILIFRKDDK